MNPKEELISIINSYAAARTSGDPPLQQFAAERLQAFLNRVEITPIQTEEDMDA